MGTIYSRTKIFHFKDKLDSLPKTVKEIMPPVHVRIKPTNICNHSCRYCAYGKDNFNIFGKNQFERSYISKEKMTEIIDDLSAMGTKAVTFSGGGEPFLYPHFLDIVRKLVHTKIKFASLTNGSLLNGEIAQLFSSHGTWIRVSMDGWDNKSYSNYRRVKPGEFSKVISNLKNFKKLRCKCYMGVSLIVDKSNVKHVYKTLEILSDIGVDSVKISPCLVNESSRDNNNYHKPFFTIVRRQIEKAEKNLVNKSFEVFNAYSELDEKFEKDYEWCPYLQILPVIGADLNVYACPDKAYNLKTGVLGSIKDQRFKDFWFSNKNNFFKINPAKQCNHHCETNQKNKLVLEYLNTNKEHLDFV